MISVSELQEDVLHDKHFQEQSGQEGVLNKEAFGGEEHGAGGEEVEGAEKRKLGIGRMDARFKLLLSPISVIHQRSGCGHSGLPG